MYRNISNMCILILHKIGAYNSGQRGTKSRTAMKRQIILFCCHCGWCWTSFVHPQKMKQPIKSILFCCHCGCCWTSSCTRHNNVCVLIVQPVSHVSSSVRKQVLGLLKIGNASASIVLVNKITVTMVLVLEVMRWCLVLLVLLALLVVVFKLQYLWVVYCLQVWLFFFMPFVFLHYILSSPLFSLSFLPNSDLMYRNSHMSGGVTS